MRFWKACVMFYLGGFAYMILEFLWRGRSHGSMFVLGGLCFLLVGKISRWLKSIPLALQLLVFSGVITILELVTGLLVNGSYQVWDYRNVQLNFLGHICLPYTLLWVPVSLGARELYRLTERSLGSVSF